MAGTGPTGGNIGQSAAELVKEMQKAQAESQKAESAPTRPGFLNTIEAMQVQQHSATQHASRVAATAGQSGRLVDDGKLSQLARRAQLDRNVTTRVGAYERGQESRFTKMVEDLVHGQDKMSKIMNIALSGRQFSPSELLAMQAGVYRFSQELDLTSKVVEKATGGIKQTLNTQV